MVYFKERSYFEFKKLKDCKGCKMILCNKKKRITSNKAVVK